MNQSTVKALPERLHVSIGGHFGTSFSVCLDGGLLTYRRSEMVQSFPETWDSRSVEVQPTEERWQAFRAALDRLGVWNWQDHYLDPEVCDGTGWSAEIAYADKSIVSGGSNCFPDRTGAPISITKAKKGDTFGRFCGAVSALVGREFR
jgi:hypothetical protein